MSSSSLPSSWSRRGRGGQEISSANYVARRFGIKAGRFVSSAYAKLDEYFSTRPTEQKPKLVRASTSHSVGRSVARAYVRVCCRRLLACLSVPF